jgi:hypothetical protein
MVFCKGISGNPNGRPKGRCNNTTIKTSKLKAQIVENTPEFLKLLWEQVQEGQPWAFRLFFDAIPKGALQDTVSILSTPETQLQDVASGLLEFQDLTYDETLNQLKVLGNLKLAEDLVKDDDNIASKLTDEQLQTVLNWTNANEKE